MTYGNTQVPPNMKRSILRENLEVNCSGPSTSDVPRKERGVASKHCRELPTGKGKTEKDRQIEQSLNLISFLERNHSIAYGETC